MMGSIDIKACPNLKTPQHSSSMIIKSFLQRNLLVKLLSNLCWSIHLTYTEVRELPCHHDRWITSCASASFSFTVNVLGSYIVVKKQKKKCIWNQFGYSFSPEVANQNWIKMKKPSRPTFKRVCFLFPQSFSKIQSSDADLQPTMSQRGS